MLKEDGQSPFGKSSFERCQLLDTLVEMRRAMTLGNIVEYMDSTVAEVSVLLSSLIDDELVLASADYMMFQANVGKLDFVTIPS